MDIIFLGIHIIFFLINLDIILILIDIKKNLFPVNKI